VGAVTVSRQYGAGGLRFAPALAEALGYRFVDREIVEEGARRLGLDPKLASERDERAPAVVEEIGLALAQGTPELGLSPVRTDDAKLAEEVRSVIVALADAGGYVILGRGGQAALRGRPDVVHLSLVGDRADRALRVRERQGLSEREAAARCERVDADRAAYVRRFYGADIRDPTLYDCVVNTSTLGIEGALEVALAACRRKLGR